MRFTRRKASAGKLEKIQEGMSERDLGILEKQETVRFYSEIRIWISIFLSQLST